MHNLESLRRTLLSSAGQYHHAGFREVVQILASDNSSESTVILADVLAVPGSRDLHSLVLDTLFDLARNGRAESMYQVWLAGRDSRLTAMLAEGCWIHDFPAHLRVVQALENNCWEAISRGGPEVVRPLLEVATGPDPAIGLKAQRCLENLTNEDAIDVLCAEWFERRSDFLRTIILEKNYRARKTIAVRVFTSLLTNAASSLQSVGPEGVEPLLDACTDQDPVICEQAHLVLSNLQNQKAIDTLAAVWAYKRTDCLDEIFRKAAYVAAEPPIVRIITILKAGKTIPQQERTDYLVHPLLQAMQDDDPLIKSGAIKLLDEMLQDRFAQEELCRLVMEHDIEPAMRVAVERGFSPADIRKRTLYYFLTEQWEEYEKLDFDMSILRQWYDQAGKELRTRISGAARRAGRLELVELVSGMRHRRRMGEMTVREWAVTLGIIRDRRDWETMWRLARTGPAIWAVEALGILLAEGWRPEQSEELFCFDNLCSLAGKCITEAPVLGMVNRPNAQFRAHGRRVSSMVVSSYFHSTLATGSWDGTVRIWSMPKGELLHTISAYTHPVTCVAASPDGSFLAGGCGSHSDIILWSIPDGTAVARFGGHIQGVSCMAISPDGRFLAAGCFDGRCLIWRLRDGAIVATLTGHSQSIRCAAFSPDGLILATGGEDTAIRLWEIHSGEPAGTLLGHRLTVRSLVFFPDGLTLASAGSDNEVMLWNLPTGQKSATLTGHDNVVSSLVVSGDGRVIASAGWDRTIRLWIMPEGVHGATLTNHLGPVTCLAGDPESRILVSGSHDCTVVQWNFQSGIFRRPAAREDMDLVSDLRKSSHSSVDAAWLDFLHAQMMWRWRYDIELSEGHPVIQAGEFDIELNG